MGITRATVWSVAAMAAAAVASGAVVCAVRGGLLRIAEQEKPAIEAAREPVNPDSAPRTVMVAAVGGGAFVNVRGDFARPTPAKAAPIEIAPTVDSPAEAPPADVVVAAATPGVREAATPAVEPAREAPPPEAAAPPATENAQSADEDDSGDVTPTLEGRTKGGKRGLVILQLGDSHTSADFLTGELRKRLQARYGRGGPGYITAGHPHIGVRTSSLTVKASKGWTYKSLQRPDAETAQFWLSGYNAIASAAGETMSFASEKPQLFDTIEIEVVRQPSGGSIDVKLDGVVETSYDLSASKVEPVVIRLVPARAATEKVREISITTKGQGPVVIASVAIYNRQTGLTYNSVGYPGAQASLVNKFNVKLLANDLVRINPQIVVLSFGTNEASNESLDIANYTAGYERMIQKIKTTLPEAQIVVISPPDFSEQSGAAGCKKDKAGKCRGPAEANAAKGSSDAIGCGWRTPARLAQIREAQREVAQRNGLVYWNWASIMPSECGAHRWFTATPPLMAKDHVHFTIEGYRKSAEQFLNTLIPVIEKVRVSANAVPNN
jgi:lysophospholipase L1-like esterase